MEGLTVSHYRILGKLGGGGMGVVYEAEDLKLGRHVALKFIPENLVGDPKSLERFEREARAASQLNHPNICTIHGIEENNGHPFIVMEKLDGESLKQRISGKPLPTDQVLDASVQVAEALAASHSKGIVHRDIKPANIFITPSGQVKVLDFGLAKLVHGEGEVTDNSLTAIGVIPGTAVYMSPEQARSDAIDARTDLFSLGVVMYEMATGKKPFSGNNSVMTLDAVLHHKPTPPHEVNPEVPAELEGIIGKAMEKDRTKRYQSANEMKADIALLRRESGSGLTRFGGAQTGRLRAATHTFARGGNKHLTYALVGLTAVLLTVLSAVGAWWWKHRSLANSAESKAVAVLPLQNSNGDASVDYLRFALADELSNSLAGSRFLEVRPSSLTRQYADSNLDIHRAGKELRVGRLITGHFIHLGDQITVTLEAIDLTSDRLLWQTNVSTPVKDLIGLQQQLNTQIQQGLLPAFGGTGTSNTAATNTARPKNQEAYDQFLRSVAIPHDPAPNKEAIAMLELAVGMDPSYAPAWEALGQRYYFDFTYGGGSEEMFKRAKAADERALSLDPTRVAAASNLITVRVERGELKQAFEEANDLVKRRPQSAEAHFALSYVLRYAGMQENAEQECSTARALDPGNYTFRSCAWAFLEMGHTQPGQEFVNLDAGSEWAAWATPYVYLSGGNTAQARESAKNVGKASPYHRDLLVACLASPQPSDLAAVAARTRADVLTEPDPEAWYRIGALLAYCGQKAPALTLLKSAVGQNYCAYSALLADPLLKDLRKETAFSEVLTAASQCQRAVREAQ